jgi:cytochrome P450
MARYPEVQVKAQVEIDMVVEKDRLPDFSDQSRLAYINAIMLECLRWQPVLPLGEHIPFRLVLWEIVELSLA